MATVQSCCRTYFYVLLTLVSSEVPRLLQVLSILCGWKSQSEGPTGIRVLDYRRMRRGGMPILRNRHCHLAKHNVFLSGARTTPSTVLGRRFGLASRNVFSYCLEEQLRDELEGKGLVRRWNLNECDVGGLLVSFPPSLQD